MVYLIIYIQLSQKPQNLLKERAILNNEKKHIKCSYCCQILATILKTNFSDTL